jgi:uncharacterized protein YukE
MASPGSQTTYDGMMASSIEFDESAQYVKTRTDDMVADINGMLYDGQTAQEFKKIMNRWREAMEVPRQTMIGISVELERDANNVLKTDTENLGDHSSIPQV